MFTSSIDQVIPRPRPLNLAPAAACAAALLAGIANAQSITNLGAVQPGHAFSQGNSVSADGTVVAGMSGVQFWEEMRSFRWSGGVATDIGAVPGALNVIGGSVSADGAWIAGTCYGGERAVAFRWSQAGGMQDLGTLPGSRFGAEAYGISGDGSVVVGAANADRPFRWTSAGGMQDLGTLPGGTYAWAFAVSADAQVVAGLSGSANGELGFVWTESGGMQPLALIDGVEYSAGLALSADGAVVAGYSGDFAARWANGVGGSLGAAAGGTFSVAYAVSGNGVVLGGMSDNANGDIVAMIWTEELGMVDLNSYLPGIGVDLTGWTLTTTTGLSFDGTTIVGAGMYDGVERGWLVTIPSPGAACLLCLGGVAMSRRRRV